MFKVEKNLENVKSLLDEIKYFANNVHAKH